MFWINVQYVISFFLSDRYHVVASVPNSNLYLVVIDAICGPCSDLVKDMGIPGEPRENILQ